MAFRNRASAGHLPQAGAGNPYPDRPKCEREWAEAIKYCDNLRTRRLLGKDGYRGMGDFYQCVMGQVSEDCGGSPTRDDDHQTESFDERTSNGRRSVGAPQAASVKSAHYLHVTSE